MNEDLYKAYNKVSEVLKKAKEDGVDGDLININATLALVTLLADKKVIEISEYADKLEFTMQKK